MPAFFDWVVAYFAILAGMIFAPPISADPAATNFPEILIGYPGMTAIIHHRLAHVFHNLGAKLLARLVAEIAHTKTGIDIHPGATIGASFFIDHGTGVVIGETTVIGDRVRIYQASDTGGAAFSDREGRHID